MSIIGLPTKLHNKPMRWNIYVKFKTFRPTTKLQGVWCISRKIDGVRVHIDRFDHNAYTRNGKKVNNFPYELRKKFLGMDFEVFCGSWGKTITKLKGPIGDEVTEDELYFIGSIIDDRLKPVFLSDPTLYHIGPLFESAIADGFEGLVIQQGYVAYKMKMNQTYDVKITGTTPGKGKYTGKIGALITEKGKVGTGLTDEIRDMTPQELIGRMIEVECMSLTDNGMFRHGRLIRFRPDKD